MPAEPSAYEIHPLTPERWHDLETLFGPRGATGGCWCMFFRLRQTEFDQQKGEGNRLALQAIVNAGQVPGLLAYDEDKPVGWCSVAPREDFSRLARSRLFQPVDDLPTWSIVCFFVARPYRRRGLAVALLRAAAAYAHRHGARAIEGYPVDTRSSTAPDVFVYTGTASAFLEAGFIEVARRSETRPVMRCVFQD